MPQLKLSGTTQLQAGMQLRALATSPSGDVSEGAVYTIVKADRDGMFWVRDDVGAKNWAFDPQGGHLNTDFEYFAVVTN